MKSKLMKIALSFILMLLVDFLFSFSMLKNLGIGNPHIGLLFVMGLFFGPYGAFGAVLANVLLDFVAGFTLVEIIPSAIFSFGVSYLAYKLWYSGFKTDKVTKPRLDTIYHLGLFLSSILLCGLVYAAAHGIMVGIFRGLEWNEFYFVYYFLNFINIAFAYGIIGILLSKRSNFIETPKKSKRPVNKKLYVGLLYSLTVVSVICSIYLLVDIDNHFQFAALAIIGILLFAYLTKPFQYEIQAPDENTITESILHKFLIITLIIAILGLLISFLSYDFILSIKRLDNLVYLMPALIITDMIIIVFFIPGIVILRDLEDKVIQPISSFSEIEGFIRENEKIESEGLVEIYSRYLNENNEIGTLARSYTELINYNNHYIENIREIEGEKERINAELDIATKIQASSLPTGPIENDDFIVNGYSHPAKEVGGDFFDYYMLDDDNLAIAIGDASGKGVPAALVTMTTQVIIKQMLKHDRNPSEVLYSLNNQLVENNSEVMFVTLFLGIYNRKTKKLTFANAGHNPPLIRENGEFRYLDIDSGIALGVLEDFDYSMKEIPLEEELVLYTDGITDANNAENEIYGEDRLLEFFNGFKSDINPIVPLLDDIHSFSEGAQQYDDMTLLFLRIK